MYKEKFDLKGKVAILSGGAGLIGTAFAEGLAEFGASVVLCDVDGRCVEQAGKLEAQFNVPCLGRRINAADRGQMERLVREVVDRFGAVHILINNAQCKTANFFEKFETYSDADLDGIVDVNLKGVHLSCQIVGCRMVEQGYGSIINLASTYVLVGPNQEIYEGTRMGCPAAYSASKGGVLALTKYLATYWASRGVRVNCISPHGVFNNHEQRFVESFSSKSPMGRMSRADEVVGAMLFLASDASSYVTGHNLMVDGGWTAW